MCAGVGVCVPGYVCVPGVWVCAPGYVCVRGVWVCAPGYVCVRGVCVQCVGVGAGCVGVGVSGCVCQGECVQVRGQLSGVSSLSIED